VAITRIQVKVLSVVFPRVTEAPTEGGQVWHILETNQGKATGNIGWRPADGERLILEGSWSAWRGQRQFKFSAACVDVAEDPRAKLAYVCERCSGVGAAMEILIWERWGAAWEQDFDDESIPRFNGRVFDNFVGAVEVVNLEEGKGRAIAWLMAKGATINMATAAWGEWQDNLVGVVEKDCYRLASLPHYSFRDVDKDIRKAFGIGDDDPRRITAGILYAIRQLTDSGSTLATWADLFNGAVALLGGQYRELITEQVSALFASGDLYGFGGAGAVALARDYWAELAIWQFAKEGKVA